MAKHVGDTTGGVIAPSDVAGGTALHRLEFLRFVCVGPKRRWHPRGMA